MKVLFGTVVYNSAWKYRQEFIDSLNAQADCEFDILVINDNVEKSEIKDLTEKATRKITVIHKPHPMSIAELRVFLLFTAKSMGYDLLILGDFDDVFSKNRVSCTIQQYSSDYAIYYNSLYTFQNQAVFHNLPDTLDGYTDILEYNVLGLSNTAINLNMLDINFIASLSEGNTIVFDWYLYSRLLLDGMKAKLVKKAITYYRIHENNIAGSATADEANILKEIEIKIKHYNLLKKYNPVFSKKSNQYKAILKNNYLQYLSRENNGYWWSKIKCKE